MQTGSAKDTSSKFKVPLRSVYYWGNLFHKGGEKGLRKKKTTPKKKANQTPFSEQKKIIKMWFSIQNKRTCAELRRQLKKINIHKSEPTLKKIIDSPSLGIHLHRHIEKRR